MMNPVAEYNHLAVAYAERELQDYMAVTKYEIIYTGVGGGEVFTAEAYERFFFFSLEPWRAVGEIARMFRPSVGEWYCPSRVYGGIGFLAYAVAEHCAEESESSGQFPHSVAVAHEKSFSHDCGDLRAVDYPHADFIAQVIEQPYVVVADEPCDFNAFVGHAGQGAEEPGESPWHYCAVFIPIIEYVSEQIQFRGLGTYGIEETHDPAFMFEGVGEVGGSQMQVGYEECFLGHLGGVAVGATGIRVRAWLLRSSCLLSIPARKPD